MDRENGEKDGDDEGDERCLEKGRMLVWWEGDENDDNNPGSNSRAFIWACCCRTAPRREKKNTRLGQTKEPLTFPLGQSSSDKLSWLN